MASSGENRTKVFGLIRDCVQSKQRLDLIKLASETNIPYKTLHGWETKVKKAMIIERRDMPAPFQVQTFSQGARAWYDPSSRLNVNNNLATSEPNDIGILRHNDFHSASLSHLSQSYTYDQVCSCFA